MNFLAENYSEYLLNYGPMNTNELTNQSSNSLIKLAATASVLTAVILLSVKAYAWWISGSVSVLASLVDSSIDALASMVNYIAVRYAMQPADKDHRFGHGKAESLAGLGQSCLIMASAVYLLVQGVDHLVEPRPLLHMETALAVMLFSIGLTAALVLFQRYVVRKTHSVAIKADSLHYLSDLLTNLGIIVALWLTTLGWVQMDAILAIAISLYIFYTAVTIWSESIQHLLDRELPEEEQKRIKSIALTHADVLGVHELRTRQSGRDKIIQLHLELDRNLPLWRAHRICDEVEFGIQTEFPNADILLHQDPYIEVPGTDVERPQGSQPF